MGRKFRVEVIAEVDVYKFAPWDLPDKSILKGDLKWYFFCPIEKKYFGGVRMNRATEVGHWKITGNDRHVNYNNALVGSIKTLIFHMGKAPGKRTDWVMHEYRLDNQYLAERGVAQNEHVLCMIFHKEGLGPRNGAQYGAPFKEEDWNDDEVDFAEAVCSACLSTPASVLPNHHSSSLAAGTSQWEDWNDDDLVEAKLSIPSHLSTPASVLPNNHSSSLSAGTSQWDGTASELCLSENGLYLHELLPAVHSNNDVSVAGTLQWDGTLSESYLSETGLYLHELLPAVHSNNDVSVAGTSQWDGTLSESCLSETGLYLQDLLPAVHSNNDVSEVLHQVLGDDVSFSTSLVSNEVKRNKFLQNPIHDGTAETALPVDESTFYEDLGDLGNTAGLSEDGHDGTAETELPVDESTFYEDLGDLGNTAGLTDLLPERLYGFENVSHDGSAEATFPFDVSELYYEALGDLGNTFGHGYDFISLEDLDEPLDCPPEAQHLSASDLFPTVVSKKERKRKREENDN
uniref:NAC domain-containing protein n=1 Tax=Fagus sylvatica TaxID=28930 RepID=A0A2N9IIN8_FAGSY